MKTNEIVPVETGKLGLEVSSIALHKKLGIKTPHRMWIARRIQECEFADGIDFRTNLFTSAAGRRAIEYILTLDVAKELAMMEFSEVGHMIRRYFIEIEKRYRDWIGFILPQLEVERDLFGQRTGYNYVKLLMSCGCSVISSSVRRRIRRNPTEFWKSAFGHFIVSERYGRTIVANAVTRRLNREAAERRPLALQEKNLREIKN